MTARHGLLAALICTAACVLLGCGQKQEMIAGADEMSDMEKRAQVLKYINQWMADVQASLQKKNMPVFPATFSRVEADGKCDIELGELTDLIEGAFMDAGVGILDSAPGTAKVKVRYELPSSGDAAKAKCRVTVALSVGASVPHFAQYYPDPRIFAVYLPADTK